MSTALKDLYNDSFFSELTPRIKKALPSFDSKLFLKNVFNSDWKQKELKQRYHRIAEVLWSQLSTEYSVAIDELISVAEVLEKDRFSMSGFEFMFLPTCIELYGIDFFKDSMRGLERITQLISGEFAVRQFYVTYPEEMMMQTLTWSQHKHHCVRRLASEGCRPALPWGMALKAFKLNPSPIFSVLENLKEDTSDFVRKSVANNLNDISKTHPEAVIATVKKWQKLNNKQTDWIIKHACRTLLKKGHKDVLPIFGFLPPTTIQTNNFDLSTKEVSIGNDVHFSFDILNNADQAVKVRIEYAVHFLRQNGEHNEKVFMISERELKTRERYTVVKKHSFKIISTRKYYPGEHHISIIINGETFDIIDFNLSE